MAKGSKGKGGTAKTTKFETTKSPKGVAGFSYLREPDTKYGAKHRVQIFVDKADAEAKAFVKMLMDTKVKYLKSINKTDPDPKKIPGLKKADAYLAEKFGKHGVKEGDPYFEFTSKARETEDGEGFRFVDIFDVKGQPADDVQVWSGDLIRASVTVAGYDTGKERGIKCYLNAVQMLEKRSSSGRTNVFGDESAEHASAETPAEGSAEGDAPFGDETSEPAAEEKPAAKGKKAEATAEPVAEAGEVDLDGLL